MNGKLNSKARIQKLPQTQDELQHDIDVLDMQLSRMDSGSVDSNDNEFSIAQELRHLMDTMEVPRVRKEDVGTDELVENPLLGIAARAAGTAIGSGVAKKITSESTCSCVSSRDDIRACLDNLTSLEDEVPEEERELTLDDEITLNRAERIMQNTSKETVDSPEVELMRSTMDSLDSDEDQLMDQFMAIALELKAKGRI
ncbi:hypothetical protein [Endozoicomonas sp. SCSIO W0465]|uniref:hypothetical protein n=1 Tax=Endozoicomonas sp. SCSIO W0465 TaxID=2918516 RepID=UPI002074EC48|nr:hypothetical protein [Endozoicomonas sp. SCSIO W0465]USE39541.1 hypothetical protein MJO57_16065 [Endozoicomonas sp. SCSIO W0465]